MYAKSFRRKNTHKTKCKNDSESTLNAVESKVRIEVEK